MSLVIRAGQSSGVSADVNPLLKVIPWIVLIQQNISAIFLLLHIFFNSVAFVILPPSAIILVRSSISSNQSLTDSFICVGTVSCAFWSCA
jgi:hypothetical protein